MRVSTLGLCVCGIIGATLVAALPSPQDATSNGRDAAIPPNANVPPFESAVLVDGVPSVGEESSSTKREIATRGTSTDEVSTLQDRQAALISAVIGITGSLAIVTAGAFIIAWAAIKNSHEFDKARKKFTRTQTEEMWKRNPDYNQFPAAACYSLGYRLANPSGFTQLANISLAAGGREVVYVIY
ncbi:hypothetical protein LZ32DRAFT_670255 [Colletotrichum eremochloae]|nr:hypothetical protein LZ32DRAFT_670255 [Colletotrichum eremochloae]